MPEPKKKGPLVRDVPKGPVLSMRTAKEISELPSEETGEGRYLWTLSASTGFQADNGNMPDAMTVRVRADTEDGALVKASQIVRRSFFRVSAVEASHE